jgi:hypothetical protein
MCFMIKLCGMNWQIIGKNNNVSFEGLEIKNK